MGAFRTDFTSTLCRFNVNLLVTGVRKRFRISEPKNEGEKPTTAKVDKEGECTNGKNMNTKAIESQRLVVGPVGCIR